MGWRAYTRSLWRSPTTTLVMLLTLSIGIGINGSVFAISEALMFRALPFDRAGELVVCSETPERARSEVSYVNYREWQRRTRAFAGLTAMTSSPFAYKLVGPEPRLVQYSAVAGNFFSLLGANAALGRTLNPDDDRIGAEPVLVLSHSYWMTQFGGDRRILGKTLTLAAIGIGGVAGQPTAFRVVGIMGPDFGYPAEVNAWSPLVPTLSNLVGPGLPDFLTYSGGNILTVLGRVPSGTDVRAARADLERVVKELSVEQGRRGQLVAGLTPLADAVLGGVRPRVWAMLGASFLLLLVASANVAALMAARVTARAGEVATRLALGASRLSLFKEGLVETALLVVPASLAGIMIARLTVPLIQGVMPPEIPRVENIAITTRVVQFAAILGLMSAAVCWSIHALNVRRINANAVSRGTVRRVQRRGLRRANQKALVACQIGSAVVLLFAVSLSAQSVSRLGRVDLGFDPDGLLRVLVETRQGLSRERPVVNAFFDEMMAGIANTRAVNAVAARGPGGLMSSIETERPRGAPSGASVMVAAESVTPDYFSTMRIPLRAGRGINDDDRESSVPVVVVSDRLARLTWPHEDPIGKLVRIPVVDSPGEWRTVVGVAADRRTADLLEVQPTIYVPATQSPHANAQIVVRTPGGDPSSIREVLRRLNPGNLALITSYEDDLARQRWPWRASLFAFGILAAATICLALVGVVGLLSAVVIEESRDIGIRIAIGASRSQVIRTVLSHVTWVLVAGTSAGLMTSLVATRWIRSMLFEVTPFDLRTLVIVPIVVVATALVASLLPSIRATGIDPVMSLRRE